MNYFGAYQSWERELRFDTTPSNDIFLPVFVRLKTADVESVKELLDLIKSENSALRIESNELHILSFYIELLENGQSSGEPMHLFLYIRERSENDEAPNPHPNYFDILQFGPPVHLNPTTPRVNDFGFDFSNVPLGFPTFGAPIFGIIDDGIGFLNQQFQKHDSNDSRIDAIWLQSRERVFSNNPHEYFSGRIYEREHISNYIRTDDEASAYDEINSTVFPEEPHRSTAFSHSHGTHVADIACGCTPGCYSEMDEVEILAVQLPPHSILDTTGKRIDMNALQALRWIIYRAIRLERFEKSPVDWLPRKLIINMSLGALAGPKDGTGFLEQQMLRELSFYEEVTGAEAQLILPFGNSHKSNQVGLIDTSNNDPNSRTVSWRVQANDATASYLEIRPQAIELQISVTPPGVASKVFSTPSIQNPTDIIFEGVLVGRIYCEPESSKSSAPAYIVAIRPTLSIDGLAQVAPSGAWTVSLQYTCPKEHHVSIQVQSGHTPSGYRPNGRQSYLSHPYVDSIDFNTGKYNKPTPPLTSDGTQSAIIVNRNTRTGLVGAVIKRKRKPEQSPQPSIYSAAGSTNSVVTVLKSPTVSATGDETRIHFGVIAAGTRSGTAVRLNGTSVAAPQYARYLLLNHLHEYKKLPLRSDRAENITPSGRIGELLIPTDGIRESNIYFD